jgi:hypothetical protein
VLLSISGVKVEGKKNFLDDICHVRGSKLVTLVTLGENFVKIVTIEEY